MLLSAVSIFVVAQSIFEILEGLMNNPVYGCVYDVSPGLISYARFEWFISYHCVVAVSGTLLPLQVSTSTLYY